MGEMRVCAWHCPQKMRLLDRILAKRLRCRAFCHYPPSTTHYPRAQEHAPDLSGRGHARRIREASPELLEQVRAGSLTIPEALRKLDGTDDDPEAVRVKKDRSRLNQLFHSLDENPGFLDRLEALLAEFA